MSDPDTADLIRKDAELVESGLKLQAEGLKLLLAEMQALAGVISAAVPPMATGTDAKTEAEAEARTEAGFDNMPV